MKGFADLADLPEDDRIRIIGETVERTTQVVGFFVDDEATADRYIEQLTTRFKVRVVTRCAHAIANTVFVKVKHRGDA